MLGFELRSDREWKSHGSKGALAVPDGTVFRFSILYAPGAAHGHLLFIDFRDSALPSSGVEPRPPNRGLVAWTFPVRDLDQALDFYQRQLGLQRGDTYDIPYKAINDAFGFPPDRRHQLTTAGLGRDVFVEIDQYPEGTPPRAAAPGMLPPAAAAVSFIAKDIDALTVAWISPPSERSETPYNGRRVGTCRGAAGELIELIEARRVQRRSRQPPHLG